MRLRHTLSAPRIAGMQRSLHGDENAAILESDPAASGQAVLRAAVVKRFTPGSVLVSLVVTAPADAAAVAVPAAMVVATGCLLRTGCPLRIGPDSGPCRLLRRRLP